MDAKLTFLFQCREQAAENAPGNTDALPSLHPKNENYHHFLLAE
jgi:hypothetical protein